MSKQITNTARLALIAFVALTVVPDRLYSQPAGAGRGQTPPAGGRRPGTRTSGPQRQPVSNHRQREVCRRRSSSAEFPTQSVPRSPELASIAGRQETRCDQRDCSGPDGNIWVADRCSPGMGACTDSDLAPIFEFDPSGKMLKNFGAGLFVYPHGMWVDKEGFVWVTDARERQGQGPAGHQVQPGRKNRDAAWKSRSRGSGQRHVQRSVRRCHGAQRRYLRGGRP